MADKHILAGIYYLIEGFKLITQPGLRRFVLVPLVINILLFSILFFVLRYYLVEFNQWFTQFLPAWLHWLSMVVWVVFVLGFFLMFVSIFVTITNILSAPFNSLLAEKVELYLTGVILEQRSVFANIKTIPHVLLRQLAIIVYYLPRAAGILILFFIPIVQMVAAVIWFVFNAWFMTLTYVDYPTDNHRMSWQQMYAWLEQRRWLGLGFGISVLVVSLVPLLNLFVVPAAVAGATKLWVEESKSGA
ncbi:MAG: hypothetical protein A3E83_00740 [Gammaproteobacteria bacterium RIFCSPHIGHO2_12_FULL_41_20]|nr:MAG: hypothetical protein A3E83_00740 [Gammaproteobacteria bacterium RIFCSPHIGHO2_12_FULL_41_20]